MLQRDNSGSVVATQTLTRRLDLGLFFSTMEELGEKIRDAELMRERRRKRGRRTGSRWHRAMPAGSLPPSHRTLQLRTLHLSLTTPTMSGTGERHRTLSVPPYPGLRRNP